MWALAGALAGPSALAGPAACQVTRILCFGIDAGVGCQGQDKGVGEVRLRCLCFSWGVDSPRTLGQLRTKVQGPGQESRVPGLWPDQTPPHTHPHNEMSQTGGGCRAVGEVSKSDSKGPVRASQPPPHHHIRQSPCLWEQREQWAGQIGEETRGRGDGARERKVKIVKKGHPVWRGQGVKRKKKKRTLQSSHVKLKKTKPLALARI